MHVRSPKEDWCLAFVEHLNQFAKASNNPRKVEAAHDYATRLAEEYYEDVDIWPDPAEAAQFELYCWHWMPNERRH